MHPAPKPHTSLALPLPPQDANGKLLSVGSMVTVLSVDSCLPELPLEDQERIRLIVGEKRSIITFDSAGFAWLCFEPDSANGADFCLFPAELSLA
jgi:hypothetical protein